MQVQFLQETLKFYQDPQLSIAPAQEALCRRLRTLWGIPETVQASRCLALALSLVSFGFKRVLGSK